LCFSVSWADTKDVVTIIARAANKKYLLILFGLVIKLRRNLS
jgi:hypothetical protein